MGAEVGSPEGRAIVVSINMLKMQAKVKIDDKAGGWIYKDFAVEDLRFKKNSQPEADDKDDELDAFFRIFSFKKKAEQE